MSIRPPPNMRPRRRGWRRRRGPVATATSGCPRARRCGGLVRREVRRKNWRSGPTRRSSLLHCRNDWQWPSRRVASDRSQDDIGHHVEKLRIVVGGSGARQGEPDVVGDGGGLTIQVVQHFDVIADEADGTQHGRFQPMLPGYTQIVTDIGFEPWILRPAAAALIHKRPVGAADTT